MKKLALTALAMFSVFGVSACNTTAGFGEDVEATGEAIERAAEKTEAKLQGEDE